MKIKTSDLTGAALDWAVAKITNPQWWDDGYMDGDPRAALDMDDGTTYTPSTDWSQGGPIIEREKIELSCGCDGPGTWRAWPDHMIYDPNVGGRNGPTPLVAAMRCYVATKLGDTVSIPNELIEE
jgi:hypothetical protein